MWRRFHKMHGLGNDFAVFDARESMLAMDGARAKALSDRKTGIGCDQLILLEPSDAADVKMRIWNSDGSEVEACGNAARCVSMLTGGGTIETAGGIISGVAEGGMVEIDMGPPRFGWEDIPLAYPLDTNALPVAWEELRQPFAVNVGNPHIVFFVDDNESFDLDHLGPLIENDPLFPQRINVNIASITPDGIDLLVWERGAGRTLACGTGACATAVAAISQGLAISPVEVRLPGGAMTIAWERGSSIRMTGPAVLVFTGEIDL
jgi:diaminopimelate epimerase